MKFYRCSICGRIEVVKDENNKQMICCGKQMDELIPKHDDAALEKHVPYCEIFGNKLNVTIGEVLHPMEENHHIEFIGILVNGKFSNITLKPGDEPKASFQYVEGCKVYSYCNLHGLWESEIL